MITMGPTSLKPLQKKRKYKPFESIPVAIIKSSVTHQQNILAGIAT